MRFRCWSDGDSPEDGRDSEVPTADWAASSFAEYAYNNSAGECGDTQVIHVRDETGLVRIFDISTDWSPDFHASERAPKDGAA